MTTTRRRFLGMIGAAASIAALEPAIRTASALAAKASPGDPKERRKLGNTGLTVSTIGIGAMTTSDSEVLRHSIDLGGDYIDTACCYMGGENERIVGRALSDGYRKKVLLATKVHIASTAKMVESCEKSLKSLKVDVIDVLQLHGISSESDVTNAEAREAMTKLVKDGKVRFPGVTTHSGQETVIRAVMKHGFYRTVLVSYNFRSSDSLTTLIREAGAAGVAMIGMKTQAGGYSLPDGSATPHQAALAWVLSNQGIATTIPSMVSFAQVDENMKARGMKLAWSGRKSLAAYGAAIADRHCAMCGSCDGMCPNGVDVPSVVRSLMYLEGYREPGLAGESYAGLGARSAAACGSCSLCTVQCRRSLPVASLCRKAHEALA